MIEINFDKLQTLRYHLRESMGYLENAPASVFPGFYCGLVEIQLAHEIIEEIFEEIESDHEA